MLKYTNIIGQFFQTNRIPKERMRTLKTITCFGSGSGQPGEPAYDSMVEVGRLLAQNDCLVVTGGFGGAGMEAPAKGATKAGGRATGYTLLGKPGNRFLTRMIDCGTYYARDEAKTPPSLEMQWSLRLASLLSSDGFIICGGGGPGTMVEFFSVINLNYKFWKEKHKRVAILNFNGWDENMVHTLAGYGVIPAEVVPLVLFTSNPKAAVDWVCGE